MKTKERLFIGIYPCGISYSDRSVEEHGDYKKLAFLPYRELVLEWYAKRCHPELAVEIKRHADSIIAHRGQFFQTSTCGQGVILGQ